MARLLQFLLFFTILTTIFAAVQYYLFRNYRKWIQESFDEARAQHLYAVGKIILVLGNLWFVLQFGARFLGWHTTLVIQLLVVLPAAFYFASVMTGLLLLVVKDFVRLLIGTVRHVVSVLKALAATSSTSVDLSSVTRVDDGRRTFLRLSGTGLLTVAVGTPVLASLATARDYRIVRQPLVFPNLPFDLDGLTIAQISDLHSGPFMSKNDMLEIFELVNSLHPLITFVTGDFVDSSDSEIKPLTSAIGMLRAEYGVFGCLGNHDHFATAARVNAALVDQRINMLNNSNATLTIDDARLSIIGIDDAGKGLRNFARPDLALQNVDPESFKILLTHRPDFFKGAKRLDIDLTLAGHTHGGQVGGKIFGVGIYPVNLVYEYSMGHYMEDGKQLYVNVGVGMVGAPIRLVRPEITLFTLHRAS
jgi:predicted MPP superfamily phosphohydrolase